MSAGPRAATVPSALPRAQTRRRWGIAGLSAFALVAPVASHASAAAPLASGWHLLRSPCPGRVQNIFFGAARDPIGGVWAVGEQASPQHARFPEPLVAHWNGSVWKAGTVPGRQTNLLAVYAPAPSDVWAAGLFAAAPLDFRLVIDHFDGRRWSAVAAPSPALSMLGGISGSSRNDIWAVGRLFTRGDARILVEHFDGRSWTRVASPSPPPTDYLDLTAVTVVARNDVWAAGDYHLNGVFRTMIEHYDGTRWTWVASPDVGSGDNLISSVTALGPRDVWAVGRAFVGAGFRPLVLHWNGTTWTARVLRAVGTGDNALNAVTVAGHTVWAAGTYTDQTGTQRTLVLRHDGNGWAAVRTPNASRGDNILYGVTRAGNNAVMAVGSRSGPGRICTLALLRARDGS